MSICALVVTVGCSGPDGVLIWVINSPVRSRRVRDICNVPPLMLRADWHRMKR